MVNSSAAPTQAVPAGGYNPQPQPGRALWSPGPSSHPVQGSKGEGQAGARAHCPASAAPAVLHRREPVRVHDDTVVVHQCPG